SWRAPRCRRPNIWDTTARVRPIIARMKGGGLRPIRRPLLSNPSFRMRILQCYAGIMSIVLYQGVDGHVGNTPLIRLRRLSKLTGCEILGKAEFMSPGGSVKDRAAYGIITDAEKQRLLQPGGTIIEGTAGNTGIGLTMIGHVRGYRTVIVIPETQSPEKISLLRTLGAEVITVPEKPYRNPENYNHIARRLAQEHGWFWANQFDNTSNRQAHYRSTGPEIWEQTK